MKVRPSLILFNFITFLKNQFSTGGVYSKLQFFQDTDQMDFSENGITIGSYFIKFSQHNL